MGKGWRGMLDMWIIALKVGFCRQNVALRVLTSTGLQLKAI